MGSQRASVTRQITPSPPSSSQTHASEPDLAKSLSHKKRRHPLRLKIELKSLGFHAAAREKLRSAGGRGL